MPVAEPQQRPKVGEPKAIVYATRCPECSSHRTGVYCTRGATRFCKCFDCESEGVHTTWKQRPGNIGPSTNP